MALAIKRVTIDRETGEVIKREIIDKNPNITEEEFYIPLARMVYDRIMKNERG